MGEYAEEAIQNGLAEEPGNSQENREQWWTDVTGRTRPVSAMDRLHLCFILNYQLQWGRSFPKDHCYYQEMGLVLKAGNWDQNKLEETLESFQAGEYQMYPTEQGSVEVYYRDLLRKYPDYSWNPLIYYMQWEK